MAWDSAHGSLDIATLQRFYVAGALSPLMVVEAVLARIDACADDAIWISRVDETTLRERAEHLTALARQGSAVLRDCPLLGIPFAVKDNIDVAEMETTAACPAFAYRATRTATVVQKLMDAGAILIGKTNLDQFATGLVGLRSPYGAPRNAVNDRLLPGGSSAGSAVAVARGLVSFALGTDTAGSGRVPAALNNIVGLKPSRGLLSNRGVVPACASLDCVSVFSLCVRDALCVAQVAKGYDAEDPFSLPRGDSETLRPVALPRRFRFAVPRADQLEFFGDRDAEKQFSAGVAALEALGGDKEVVDFEPFRRAATLLYQGPWVAERALAAQSLLDEQPEAIHPDVRTAMQRAKHYTATDVFAAQHQLMQLRRTAHELLGGFECLVVPTVGRTYSVEETLSDPVKVNTNLGYYMNFVNLLDLAAVAVPAAMSPDAVPFGLTLIGLPLSENRLAAVAAALHRAVHLTMGATTHAVPPSPEVAIDTAAITLCVSGAHMTGLTLNHQLTERGAYLLRSARTAPRYRLYALLNLQPARPGMLRVEPGVAVDVELWAMPMARFGDFVAAIPGPLGIGKVELENGEAVCGFLCESHAVEQAEDISEFGGWRAYLAGAGFRGGR